MQNPTIEISKTQIMDALTQYSPEELKNLMDELFAKDLFTPPSLEEICEEASEIVRRKNLDISVVDEAIKWARSKK